MRERNWEKSKDVLSAASERPRPDYHARTEKTGGKKLQSLKSVKDKPVVLSNK
jgi:hypothetical protein